MLLSSFFRLSSLFIIMYMCEYMSTTCIYTCTCISFLRKRRLYTTKVPCYLQSSGILFVLCSKNNKQKYMSKYNTSNNTSSNEIQL